MQECIVHVLHCPPLFLLASLSHLSQCVHCLLRNATPRIAIPESTTRRGYFIGRFLLMLCRQWYVGTREDATINLLRLSARSSHNCWVRFYLYVASFICLKRVRGIAFEASLKLLRVRVTLISNEYRISGSIKYIYNWMTNANDYTILAIIGWLIPVILQCSLSAEDSTNNKLTINIILPENCFCWMLFFY